MSAYIYIEGGAKGADSKWLNIRCQEGFHKLLDRMGFKGRKPRLVACGSRSAVYDRFVIEHLQNVAGYSFAFNLSRETESDTPDPTDILIHSFNRVESIRRMVRESRPEVWRPIVELFDKSGETASAPLIWQANRFQAMHIAFAIVGDLARAREALIKSRMAAELLGLAEDIFTVKTYTNVPVRDFIAINDEMLAAINKGQLWDGMPLPDPPVPAPEHPTEPRI